MPTHKQRACFLLLLAAAGIVAMLFVPPMAQDPRYHSFADTERIGGIANFWNVVSNVPFLAAGLFGLWRYPRLEQRESRVGYWLLCGGIFLVGLGSAWYHSSPSNASLLWDRLPMTVAFMALFGMLLAERVIATHKNLVLGLLVLLGICAALYWSWTEANGHGDLRPYIVVQFLPIVLVPLILIMFPARYLRTALLLWAVGLYGVAKALEHLDGPILSMTGLVSGHTLKHVVAAVAVICIILAVPATAAPDRSLKRPPAGALLDSDDG